MKLTDHEWKQLDARGAEEENRGFDWLREAVDAILAARQKALVYAEDETVVSLAIELAEEQGRLSKLRWLLVHGDDADPSALVLRARDLLAGA